jgi:hypothetical protein
MFLQTSLPAYEGSQPGGVQGGGRATPFLGPSGRDTENSACVTQLFAKDRQDVQEAENLTRFQAGNRKICQREVFAGNLNSRSPTAISAKIVLSRDGALRANGCASGGGGGGDPHQNFTGYTMRAFISSQS